VRFLHTADWQIGMKATHVGQAGVGVREARLEAGRGVVAEARERGVAFILSAGDLFEDNAVDRVVVQKVADILASFEGPVYLLPGNHDPIVPGSVWEHPAWRRPNLHILAEAAPVAVPGGTLFPCPAFAKQSGKDPTAWIPTDGTGIRVGVAHGTVEGVRQDEPEFPIPRDAADRRSLDYLAIGHWHSTALYSAADGAPRMAYSGTHETTKFGERDSGNALLVEIDAPRAAPRVAPVRTGQLRWDALMPDLRAPGELAAWRARVEAYEDTEHTLLDLRLNGLLFPEDRDEVRRIEEIAVARFLYARVDASALMPAPQDDRWIADLPAGVIQEAARRLRQLADPSFPGQRPEGATTFVAARALQDLLVLARTARAREEDA